MPSNAAGLTRRQVRLAVIGIFTSAFVATIDATIVATALQTIAGELGRPGQGPLVVVTYLLATTMGTPFWGRYGDIRGRKPTMQLLVGLFSLTSLAVALAPTMALLLIARTAQGFAGGGILTMYRSLIGDIATPRERGRYQWMASGVWVLATALGPVAGGFFVDHASWRWAFAINLPLGALAMIVLHYGVPATPAQPGRRLNIPSTLLLGLALAAVSLGLLSAGGEGVEWGGTGIAACIAAGVVFLIAFAAWERREAQPLLPVPYLKNRTVAVSLLMTFFSAIVTYQVVVFAPLFAQIVKEDGATRSGVIIMPLILGNLWASFLCGRLIVRTGRYRASVMLGAVLCSAGALLLANIDGASPRSSLAIAIFILGTGNGLVSPTMFLIAQNAIPHRDLGTASSMVTLARSVGNVIGVGVVGSFFAHTLSERLRAAGLASLDPDTLRAKPSEIAELPADEARLVRDAFDAGLNQGFRSVVIPALLLIVVALFLRAEPLRDSND